MKTYKSNELSSKRAEIMNEAAESGVIIQECKTNGKVVREFVIIPNSWKEEDYVWAKG